MKRFIFFFILLLTVSLTAVQAKTKVESPIVGATKLHHIGGAVKSLDVHLSADDIRYLEEPYVPHNLSGVMAVNKPVMNEESVWVAASKNK
jgi:hypothetical protein